MDNLKQLQTLEERIKVLCPSFEVRFKDESLLMKVLGKVMFFNKGFMTDFITTFGSKVYFPNRKKFLDDPLTSFRTLAHEFVHIMDYKKNPVWFVLSYAAPQALTLLALLSVFTPLWHYFIWSLLALFFVLPIPSLGRKNIETRGYGMSLKTLLWDGYNKMPEDYLLYCVENFTGSGYYFMWPFKNSIIDELKKYSSDDCLNDPNPAYKEVYNILKS
jgi:hypothetical protein